MKTHLLALGALLLVACGGGAAPTPNVDDAPARSSGAEVRVPPAAPETRVELLIDELDGIQYLEMVIGDADEDEPLPTVWILHGRGARARPPSGPFDGLPGPVRVFVPQAPTPLGEGFTWLPVRVAEGRTEELAAALDVMAARLAALIEHFRQARPTRGRPIVTGFSQGGLLSFALALRHPEVVAGAFPGAGWLPPRLVPELREPARFPPIRAVHGDADTIIEVEPTRALVRRLRDAGLDVELVEEPGVGHVMGPAMEAQLGRWLQQALRGDRIGGRAEHGAETEEAETEEADEDAERSSTPSPR